MKALVQLGDVASFQAHLGADGSDAYASSLARLVREAPLAAGLAPYYERHINVLLASVTSLPAGCAGPMVVVTPGNCITRVGMQGPAPPGIEERMRCTPREWVIYWQVGPAGCCGNCCAGRMPSVGWCTRLCSTSGGSPGFAVRGLDWDLEPGAEGRCGMAEGGCGAGACIPSLAWRGVSAGPAPAACRTGGRAAAEACTATA